MAHQSDRPVAIIGAGVAGLACASVLRRAKIPTRIFDKGRGAGGRCSTRRSPVGPFDFGCPSFIATSPDFKDALEPWLSLGVLSPLEGAGDHFVGSPSMNAFLRHEAAAAEVEFGVRVAPPTPLVDGGYLLRTETGEALTEASHVVIASPAEQAADLLTDASPRLADAARSVKSSPLWVAMIAYEDDDLPWPQNIKATGPLAKILPEGAKPKRPTGRRFVLHATTEWSVTHLEKQADEVANLLATQFESQLAPQSLPRRRAHLSAHRWRYAQIDTPALLAPSAQLDGTVAVCGDWTGAPGTSGVQNAWQSGHAAGLGIINLLG